jgi:hypothetical protein
VQQLRLGTTLKTLLQELNAIHIVRRDQVLITSQSQAKRQNTWSVEKTRAELLADEAADENTRQKLKLAVTLRFVETPLSDVLDFLRDCTQTNFALDREWLDNEGIDSDIPVTIHVEQVSLETALQEILDKLHGTIAIRDGLIVLTSKSPPREQAR